MSKLVKHFYEFGPFRLDATERLLVRDGAPLPLPPKVFDTLLVLVENHGHIVEKEELMKQVWPDTAVGHGLQVESVLEGSIRRVAERIRVTVQLVSVDRGAPLWADKFDEKFSDFFTVEDSISEKVARALLAKLSSEEKNLLTKHYTENTEAYQLYLKGRYYAAKFTQQGLKKGIECLEQAIALDPNYALAYQGLAYYYAACASEFVLPHREAMPEARAAAKKALELDDTLVEAYGHLAAVTFWYDWDWEVAEREFQQAVELNPNNAIIRYVYSFALACMARFDEAIAEGQRAQQLDPLSPEVNTNLGINLYFARRYDEAIEQLQKTIEIDSNYWFAYLQLGRAYEQKGRLPEAINAFQKAWQLEDSFPEVLAALGHAYALSGERDKAHEMIAEVHKRAERIHVSAYHLATVYAGLGETDQAFEWLEKAYEERAFFMTWLNVDPALDNLRSDPRFIALLRRIGLQ